jgi:hypothetical protein
MNRLLPCALVGLHLTSACAGCGDDDVSDIIELDRPPLTVGAEGEGEGEGEASEGEGEGEGAEGEGEPACSNADLLVASGAAKHRLLVTFPFDDSIGAFDVDSGVVTVTGPRVDLGFAAARVEFLPSGTMALVVGEDGQLATLRVGADELEVLDEVAREPRFDDPPATETTLPGAGFGDLTMTNRLEAGGVVAYVTGSNSVATAGVSKVLVACDGEITIDTTAHYGVRLAYALAALPNDRALLFGGDVSGFEPRDPHDLRLLSLGSGPTTEIAGFDVLEGFLGATRIAAATDGSFALVPNFSISGDPDSGDVILVDIVGDSVSERGRIEGLQTPSEVVIAPDNSVAAVSDWEADAVVIVDVRATASVITTFSGIGLAEQMALVKSGAFAGRVFVPEVRASGGSFITAIDLGDGVGTRGASYVLDDADIPVGIAISP